MNGLPPSAFGGTRHPDGWTTPIQTHFPDHHPRRRWYGFFTRPVYRLLTKVLSRTKRWRLTRAYGDPDNPLTWALSSKPPFGGVMFPIIKAVFPNTFIEDLMSVQPMTTPRKAAIFWCKETDSASKPA